MKALRAFLATLCLSATTAMAAEAVALVRLANPLQGTDSTGGFSHGNTFPAIALPFPMNVWANTIFGEFVWKTFQERPQLLGQSNL